MEDCTRVVLYGTFDGAAFPTDNFLQVAVILDSGEKVKIPTECVTSADKIVKKDEIKLKDVIKRIEKFDLGTKAVWINEILYKLGSYYGLHKHYAGYKQGKFDSAVEREKVEVEQFVDDYIKHAKEKDWDLQDLFEFVGDEDRGGLREWFYDGCNQETLALAWIFGYEIKKEKQYKVKMKGIEDHNSYLKYNKNLKHWYFGSLFIYNNDVDTKTYHTRKELEEAGFGDVFDSPLFEVEEVKL